jgi:hypothetical protein
MAARYTLRVDQGATFHRTIVWAEPLVDVDGNLILDADGQVQQGDPIDLTGYTGRMKIRKAISEPTSMLSIDSGDGGIVLGGTNGTIQIVITDEQSASLKTSGVYDLELESPGGEVTRILQGKVRVSAEVTHE